MASSNVLGPFLQDIIGRDEVLTPASGRLRTIHARIVKEVEDAKQELHATVQQQWPTLKRQYNTTIDLSDRLKAITGEVQSLEGDLDGDDTALRPRLQASFAAHTQLSKRHKDSDALVDLLHSLKSLQDSNNAVEVLLREGRLDEVVPALQKSDQIINAEIEDWKKDCQPYKSMKEQYNHARTIAKERLEEALDRCVTLSSDRLVLSSYTNCSEASSPYNLSLQAIIKSLAAVSPIEQHFERIANAILKQVIKPVLVDGTVSVAVDASAENSRTLYLQPQSSSSLPTAIHSIQAALQAVRSSIASDEASPAHRQAFLRLIIPQVQQMLIDHVLVRSIPRTADSSALEAFQQTCNTVSIFETSDLLDSSKSFEPIVQQWTQHAGEHWSNAIIQRCFATLRADVTTSDYWNTTVSVEWLDDSTGEDDKQRWERWMSAAITPVTEPQQPLASTSKLPNTLVQSVPMHVKPTVPEKEEVEEDIAWEFDEDGNDESESSKPHAALPTTQTSTIDPTQSPDPNADDAWGFDEDELIQDGVSEHNSPPRVNGHKKNSLSTSSTRSRASQRSTRSAKGKGVSQTLEDDGQAGEDDDGGWSFDADADLEIDDGSEQPITSGNLPIHNSAAPGVAEGKHSRHSSIDDAWGWSRNPDPEEDQPIGNPTKVIVSKKLGAKGRTGSPAPSFPSNVDLESTPSRSATPLASAHQFGNQTVPSGERLEIDNTATPMVEEPSVQQKKQQTKMLVSSNAKRVNEVALELLEAALAVSTASHLSADMTSSSKRLFKAFSDTFDLYRAIMPVAHSALISTVPSIGMQFSNDCLFVARKGTDITTDMLDRRMLGSDEKVARRKPLEALRTFGYRVLDDQIELQRVPLMETLDEADGFRSTDDPRTFSQCQRCVRQLVHTITSISHAWKPVLIKRVYFESLGILVNAVLLRVLVEIENQEDISEESSHRLNDLCKMLHELESLFQDGEESTVAMHVPVWFKFKFLSELLEASMADIMYLFNEGHLVDFSSTELSKLVRALFADSQLRQRNLETIARGRA